MESNSTRLFVAGSVSHSIAIICTIFRLVYRGWTHRLWWEDAWAAVALISDVICLAYLWTPSPDLPPMVLALALTSVWWAARMSLIFCIIRIANHSGSKIQKWITYFIAVSFACMWTGVLIQKVNLCIFHACHIAEPVALSQLITDVVADFSLVAAPLQFWKNVGLSSSRKISVLSSFGASILITAITIPHSVVLILFSSKTDTILIIAHVKAAVSLIICNLFVIVIFAYRVLLTETCDLEQSFTSPEMFSTVIMTQFPISTHARTSFHGQEGTISTQITTGPTKLKPHDISMVSTEPEEGTVDGMTGNMKDGR
ncbi:hypothetical protein BDR07DRAFT_783238 [Suillus spraguei]|nr:hypothetical protein BDR07DRAFT_783238 [Suillus spraguei]